MLRMTMLSLLLVSSIAGQDVKLKGQVDRVTLYRGDVVSVSLIDVDLVRHDPIIRRDFDVDGTTFSHGRLKSLELRCR